VKNSRLPQPKRAAITDDELIKQPIEADELLEKWNNAAGQWLAVLFPTTTSSNQEVFTATRALPTESALSAPIPTVTMCSSLLNRIMSRVGRKLCFRNHRIDYNLVVTNLE
jgi:hypothetical protein